MSKNGIFNQPKAFFLIFSIELWERFGFYGLNVILPLYISKELGLSSGDSAILFSVFNMLLFGGIAIGGYIGDKILGTKRTIIFSAIVLFLGYFGMALAHENKNAIYLCLSIIAVGAGLFKSNPSALLSNLYKEGDSRIDGAFTLYYMAINIGALISMFLTPYLSSHPALIKLGINYTVSFACSAIGLFVALANFIFMLKIVKDYGSKADFEPFSFMKMFFVLFGTICAIFICYFMLQIQLLATIVVAVLIIGILIVFIIEVFKLHGIARIKMFISLVFSLQIFFFFIMYYQMYTSVNFFAILNVKPYFFGIKVDPQSFQNLDALYIVILSPILAILYQKLGSKFSLALKISFGVFITSFMFLVLSIGASSVGEDGYISPIWLEIGYLFLAIGELLTSALGLSMMAQLVPSRLVGFAMGAYFLSTSAATYVAGYVSAYIDSLLPNQLSFAELGSLSSEAMLEYQLSFANTSSMVFMKIFIFGAIIGGFFMLCSFYITKVLKDS